MHLSFHSSFHSMFAPGDRILGTAIGVSLALHAVALAVHFKFPEAMRWKAESQPLEVVLVNAKTRERPAKAEGLAPANLGRGGAPGARGGADPHQAGAGGGGGRRRAAPRRPCR